MRSFCLTLSRFFAASWCGAGVFFVIVLIAMRASTLFDDETKLRHPLVLFPIYYQMEFICLGSALVLGTVAIGHSQLRKRRGSAYLGLLLVALAVAVVDYFAIYRPLNDMIEHSLLTANFRPYHTASRWANTAVLVLSLAASLISLAPTSERQPPGSIL